MMAIRLVGKAFPAILALAAMFPPLAFADAGSGTVAAPYAALNQPASETAAQLEARIAKLVRLMGDPEYSIRQAAHNELASIGLPALEAIIAAQHDDDMEIASRAKSLTSQLGMTWVRSGAAPQVKEI